MTRTQEELAEMMKAEAMIATAQADLLAKVKAEIDGNYHAEFEQVLDGCFSDLLDNTVSYWRGQCEDAVPAERPYCRPKVA